MAEHRPIPSLCEQQVRRAWEDAANATGPGVTSAADSGTVVVRKKEKERHRYLKSHTNFRKI